MKRICQLGDKKPGLFSQVGQQRDREKHSLFFKEVLFVAAGKKITFFSSSQRRGVVLYLIGHLVEIVSHILDANNSGTLLGV